MDMDDKKKDMIMYVCIAIGLVITVLMLFTEGTFV